MELILIDDSTYTKIPGNTDIKVINKIIKFTSIHRKCLSNNEIKYLTKFDYKTSELYGLPKIHKSEQIKLKTPQEGLVSIHNPDDLSFRPIIAGPKCPTHRLSHLMDLILQPYIKYIPSYIKDSNDLLNKLPKSINYNEKFITIDIKSLYTNINTELGLKAIEYWVNKYPGETKFKVDFILNGCDLVLKNNYFNFDNKHYLQISGTAMGTKMAPSYATLTLGYLEEKLFENNNTVKRDKYFRYLDDILIIWNENWGNHEDFLNELNNVDNKLEFLCDKIGESVNFLDLVIYKTNDKIETDIYYKDTDTKQYLNYHSNHPRHIKNNIPFNLARRIRNIVSNEEVRKMRMLELEKYLKLCNYPTKLIKSGIKKANELSLMDLRNETANSKNNRNNNNTIPFVTTYNPKISDNSEIVSHVFNHIKNIPSLKEKFKGKTIIKSKRQTKNLKQILTSAKFGTKTKPKITKCGDKRCQLCQNIIEDCRIKINKKEFEIRSSMDCNTKFCIYAIRCSNCELTYIGETNNLRLRYNLHKQHVRENAPFFVSKHLHACGKGEFSIMPIFKMKDENENDRKEKEMHFIKKFLPELNRKL